MAYQSIPGGLIYPNPLPTQISGAPNFYQSFVIDAASEKAAFIFQAPVAGDITAVAWRTVTVTTGATVDVRLENVSLTTGDPDGTLEGTNTNGSQVVADANDNVWFTTTLTAAATVTKGQLLALVIVNPAASFGNMQIALFADSFYDFPLSDLYTTVWTKDSRTPIMALSYGGTYYPVEGVFPYSNISTYVYNVDTVAQDEVALKFKVPFPTKTDGGFVWLDADGDFDVVLYDSDGSTVLATSTTQDANVRQSTGAAILYFNFTATATLSKDTFYYLSVKPTTTTSITLSYFDVSAVAVMDACIGGQNAHSAVRVDAGAWTATTTRRPFISLLLNSFDDGVGGSGGILRHPGMAGGLNG